MTTIYRLLDYETYQNYEQWVKNELPAQSWVTADKPEHLRLVAKWEEKPVLVKVVVGGDLDDHF